ncbi:hypothetical protein Xcel_2703 [Xylanimonas cellulosilytica DSM 15894]|uniref:DUF4190 domain-containing protein n=1 Tax=Xylanimonas cellulosilytica (strain DSM 15894 / JCM 12276 / CECT 5975 / KCTC 9989 / LMG 20990 / NBRC 107835 / XIL07) TaxID=446471 RepID=D1BXS6_XYLCX|nr:DUF4190 domain-containing protein [Xylanimonas cellulosilytica]ACZ31717.1 hypothetical protein Xcel_2703 [Xylanimonas cellulosilytica DSM 15894]
MSSDPYGIRPSEPHGGPTPPSGQPSYYGEPTSGQQPYGDPATHQPYGQHPQQPYPYAQPGYGYAPTGPGTDGLAIGALVSGILGLTVVPLLASVVALVLGIMSLGRIRQSGQEGRGMAITGIVLGAAGVALLLLAIVGLILLFGFASTGSGPVVEFHSTI